LFLFLFFFNLKGYKRRLFGGYTQVRQKATVTGGNFAAWGGMFSVCDCTLAHIRKKDDALNSIASGFITGGILQARRKFKLCLYNFQIYKLIIIH
jgi:hypothetical protein